MTAILKDFALEKFPLAKVKERSSFERFVVRGIPPGREISEVDLGAFHRGPIKSIGLLVKSDHEFGTSKKKVSKTLICRVLSGAFFGIMRCVFPKSNHPFCLGRMFFVVSNAAGDWRCPTL